MLMVCAKAMAPLNIITAMFTLEIGITISAQAEECASIKTATHTKVIGRTTPAIMAL